MKFNIFSVLLIIIVVFAQSALAKSDVYVVDGDSIFIGKKEIRLSGIDAPEYHQLCKNAQDKDYECGLEARKALVKLVGSDFKCQKIVKDRYKREVSECESRGVNINKKMVEIGWAVAYNRYTDEYVDAEKLAKKQKSGVWQGRFMKPELYRILHKRTDKKREKQN